MIYKNIKRFSKKGSPKSKLNYPTCKKCKIIYSKGMARDMTKKSSKSNSKNDKIILGAKFLFKNLSSI